MIFPARSRILSPLVPIPFFHRLSHIILCFIASKKINTEIGTVQVEGKRIRKRLGEKILLPPRQIFLSNSSIVTFSQTQPVKIFVFSPAYPPHRVLHASSHTTTTVRIGKPLQCPPSSCPRDCLTQ